MVQDEAELEVSEKPTKKKEEESLKGEKILGNKDSRDEKDDSRENRKNKIKSDEEPENIRAYAEESEAKKR